ncbi:phosphatase PAP2 family protein [Streptomyces purpureus]|uniref:Phosphatase PAP2 family protein n=1 Tax=Streptomyces purpureus TaxID=1951 RepID=A0A918HGS8_9ACTN|nr:phosphatase PAP2 family protein [Streptomyces purpureus]GGT59820.1 phosphatase PAP2 family protein [Streptomyces purpureus]
MRSSTPGAPPTLLSARTWALWTGALSAVLLVLVAVDWAPLISVDRKVAHRLHRDAVAEPGLTEANQVLSDWVWDPWTMRALIAVAVVALWWRGQRRLALWVAATSVLATVVQQGLKTALGRERPRWPDPVDFAHYAAYPSGHAMTAAVTCGLLLWLLARRYPGPRLWWAAVALAVVSVLGVGLTRIYLGVHWITDVVGGWLLGALTVALAVLLYGRGGGWRQGHEGRPKPPVLRRSPASPQNRRPPR